MKNQDLLDELGKKPDQKRLEAITKNSEYILSEEFVTFLEGLLEFAEITQNDPGYFERIYVGEDSSFLELMKSEMEKQTEVVKDVWETVQCFRNQHNIQILVKTGKSEIFADSLGKSIAEILPCGKCDELIKSYGLCNLCLSGRISKKVMETLKNVPEGYYQTQFNKTRKVSSGKHLNN